MEEFLQKRLHGGVRIIRVEHLRRGIGHSDARAAGVVRWPPRKTVAIWRLKWKLIETMSAKEILLEVAEKLPPEVTLNDAIYELEFRQSVQQGLDELDRGEGIPIEQVKAKIAAWAGK